MLFWGCGWERSLKRNSAAYLCKTWFLLLPQAHFFILELYFCQQYPQQYDFIVSPDIFS